MISYTLRSGNGLLIPTHGSYTHSNYPLLYWKVKLPENSEYSEVPAIRRKNPSFFEGSFDEIQEKNLWKKLDLFREEIFKILKRILKI